MTVVFSEEGPFLLKRDAFLSVNEEMFMSKCSHANRLPTTRSYVGYSTYSFVVVVDDSVGPTRF